MISWKTYKIGDLCKISSSKRIFAKEYKDSGIPFYRGKEIIEKQKGNKISTELYISQERYDEIRTKHGVPQKGDMLLTSVGTLGIPYIVQDEVFYFKDGNLTWFYDFDDLDSRYLYYWFLSPIGKMNIDSKAIGSTQKALTIETLSKFELSLPPLPEQRRIADILGAIDDKIENNRRINTNLELQAQALYKQWFVDFDFPNKEGKPYKSSGGKMIDSELGLIPEGWRVIGYCDIVDIKGGGTPPTNKPEFWNGSIPFFTPKDVSSECFVLKTEKSITESGLSNCNSKLYAKDTVFITARGTVGKVAMAGCSMAMNQTNYALIGKNGLSQYFVYLLTIALVDKLLKKANGAVFNAITTRDFEGEQIVHPTNGVLDKFIDTISALYQQVLSIAKENETLATLRDTLLPKLMNGEIKL
jgi:type I restriction enzyme S subunit